MTVPVYKLVIPFLLLPIFFFSVSFPVYADHHLVFISHVVKIDDTLCAVELEISGNDQDAFAASDLIQINDETLVTLSDVIALGINQQDGNNDSGDTILAASASFATAVAATLSPDLSFTDSLCADFDADVKIRFVLDYDEVIDTVNAADFPGFGEINTAIRHASGGDDELVDLLSDYTVLQNNDGDSVIVGTVDACASENSDNVRYVCEDTQATASNEAVMVSCALVTNARMRRADGGALLALCGVALMIGILARRIKS